MLATRIQSFGQYIFNIQDYPVMMEKLFFSEKFIEAAKKICPSEKQVLDPYSFHFVIQVCSSLTFFRFYSRLDSRTSSTHPYRLSIHGRCLTIPLPSMVADNYGRIGTVSRQVDRTSSSKQEEITFLVEF